MDPAQRQAYEATRTIADKPFASACYSPFTSLFFHPNGNVTPCCKNSSYVLGNVQQLTLQQIWQGARTQALRRNLRNYNFQLNCDFCRWQIEGGQFDQVYATTFDRLRVAGDAPEWPAMLEFTLSNTCNLACIMCYGELSSTIRAHREKLPPLPRVYGDPFFEQLRPFLPHLQVAKFFGGEPFLSQENLRIWETMIEDRLAVPCHVTTNGTQWNARVERVLDLLPVAISISVDGATRETVESIRVNARFDEVMANVRRFRDHALRKKTFLSLTYCLMQQNWHEFGEYLRLGDELGVPVYINTVTHPPQCSLYALPPEELQGVCDRMQAMDDERHYSTLPKNGRIWVSGLDALRKNANERQRAGLQQVQRNAAKLRAVVTGNHLQRARDLEEEGLLDAAVLEYRRVPEGADSFAAALGESGVCRRLGQLDAAETAARRATVRWASAPEPWRELAAVLKARGDAAGAREAQARAELLQTQENG